MPFIPFIIILMFVSGLPGFMIFISPEIFKADPLSTAMFMSGIAFALCWVAFFALFKMSEARRRSAFDKCILDFLKFHPEYRIEFIRGEWSAYSSKTHKACYHKTLRNCLSILRIMHRQTTGWEPRK